MNDATTTEILLSDDGLPALRALFQKYTNKAARFGLTAPTLVEHGCVAWHRGETTGRIFELHRVEVQGVKPRVGGYDLLAKLHYMAGASTPLVMAPAGCDVPPRYRGALPVCDHCGTARRRSDTFVLRSDAGETIQVGRNCLADFMPETDAASVLDWFAFYDEAMEIARDHVPGEGNRDDGAMPLELFLGYVAIAMRVDGGFRSTKCEDERNPSTKSTVLEIDGLIMSPRKTPEMRAALRRYDNGIPNPADRAEVAATLAWAEALPEDCESYLHNLRTIARIGKVDRLGYALAASMIAAYRRAMGHDVSRGGAKAPSAHQGTVGQRLTVDLTVKRFFERDGSYGVTTFYILADATGNAFTWSASGAAKMDVDATYRVTGTVKAHGDYQGTAQTVLTRCKVAPLAPVAVAA